MICTEAKTCSRSNRVKQTNLDDDFWRHFPDCPSCQAAVVSLLREWELRTWMRDSRN
jgi:hypothetical protein